MTAATKAGPTHIEVKRNDREIMVLIDEAKRGELVKACGRRLTNTGITNWLTFKNHELRSFLKGEADPKQGQAVQAAATVATAKANGDGGILDAIARRSTERSKRGWTRKPSLRSSRRTRTACMTGCRKH
jgi:hypothetical protein